MIKFFREMEGNLKLQQVAALLPWGHICLVLDKCKHEEERFFYFQETVKNGFSRDVLLFQITNNLYARKNQEKTHNFELTLTENSDLADEIVKNEYALALTGGLDYSREKNLEKNS